MQRFTAFLLLLSLLFAANKASAQTTKFPENPGDYMEKLDEFMNASKRPDMAEAYTVFKKAYKSALLKETDMTRIIALSNRMGELKLAAYPYFRNYINAVSAAKMQADSTAFDRWHSAAEKRWPLQCRAKQGQLAFLWSFRPILWGRVRSKPAKAALLPGKYAAENGILILWIQPARHCST